MPRPGLAQATGVALLGATGAAALWALRRVAPLPGRVTMQPVGARRRHHVAKAAGRGAPAGGLEVDPSKYPPARRDETVVEELHGVRVADPYRWLEDPDAPEVKAFVAAQNLVTDEALARCPTRARFAELLEGLMDYPRYGTPSRKGGRYYFSHNSGLQAQSVLRSATEASGGAESTAFLDPNELSSDGTVALGSYSFSRDGSRFAYALGSGGSDWRTVKVARVDPASGARVDLRDELHHVKFSPLAWLVDGSGFFYCRYPAPDTGDAGTEVTKAEGQQLAFHVAGTDQADDATVLALADHPDWMLGCELTDDGTTLLVTVVRGCEPANLVWALDLSHLPARDVRVDLSPAAPGGDAAAAGDGAPGVAPYPESVSVPDLRPYDVRSAAAKKLPLARLVDEFVAEHDYVGDVGDRRIFRTNAGAGAYKLVTAAKGAGADDTEGGGKAGAGAPSFADLVPERPHLLEWAARLAGDVVLLAYLEDVHAALELRSATTGDLIRRVELPGIGSIGGFSGDHTSSEYFLTFTGFTEPGLVLGGDASLPEEPLRQLRRMLPRGFDPDAFETEQLFATSRDGTRVPFFLVRARGAEGEGGERGAGGDEGEGGDRDPPRGPTLLYGYGGFNISLTPSFSPSRVAWLLAYGGSAAIANLRGGGEYGTAWRDAGSVLRKQNVFDDFAACAEALIARGVAAPGGLVAQGGSNGGLLVAAAAEQRPDLFAAVLCQVGVLDMLRFHKFTIGHAWVTDYGSADDPEQFENLLRYSPLHNVARPRLDASGSPRGGEGGQYPAVMVTTGDHDDRVVPLHSLKFIATLQSTLGGPGSPQTNPLLARVETRAGHGAGKPTAKVIAEVADMYGFAAAVTGARWRGPPLPPPETGDEALKAAI